MDRNQVKTKQYDIDLKKPQFFSFKIPKKKTMFQGVNQKYLNNISKLAKPLTSRSNNFLSYQEYATRAQFYSLSPTYSSTFLPVLSTATLKEVSPRLHPLTSPRTFNNTKFVHINKNYSSPGYMVTGVKKSLHSMKLSQKQKVEDNKS
ncbi:hypothetical protein SteCoe_39740 [Stentor coeruleus]|uniref:Uncharacterized protein n=1 Tax=Stentor coeruleus TaxID=5963 RepID=A0A1R2AKK3_9CILI|nr:hypothetical protein SteCoe_39740 [Stentor coeruleus]